MKEHVALGDTQGLFPRGEEHPRSSVARDETRGEGSDYSRPHVLIRGARRIVLSRLQSCGRILGEGH